MPVSYLSVLTSSTSVWGGFPLSTRHLRGEFDSLLVNVSVAHESRSLNYLKYCLFKSTMYQRLFLLLLPPVQARIEEKCKARMQITAFSQNEHSIKEILKSQVIPDFTDGKASLGSV